MAEPRSADRSRWRAWLRALALAVVGAAGLASLVGSGGGFPPCEGSFCDGTPPPTVRVDPDVATVTVGTAPAFRVQVWDAGGPITVQWQRSSDGLNYADIAGATGTTLTLLPANLADDGVRLRAVVSSPNGMSRAVGRLAVSATAAVVFEDGDFEPSNWLLAGLPLFNQTNGGSAVEERQGSGGNPGAFRRSTVQVSLPSGLSLRLGLWLPATYDPGTQGAIRHVDHRVDCIDLNPADTRGTELYAAFEQAGRRYVSNFGVLCRSANAWQSYTLGGLQPGDFRLAQGDACGAGEACPDFSAAGAPIRFGEHRSFLGAGGETVVHGTDNWRVSVWRR